MQYLPFVFIFLPIITALLIYIFHNNKVNFLIFPTQLILFGSTIVYMKFLWPDFIHYIHIGNWPAGIGVSLKNDSLSIKFIIAGVLLWTVVSFFSWKKYKHDYKFLFFLLFIQGTYMGIVQTNDFFNFFILLELLTIISTILIIYKKDSYSLRSGLNYLMINSFGMLFYIVGLSFLYASYGSVNMDILKESITNQGLTTIQIFSYVFMIGGISIKAAFFPMYNWLPEAHSAAPGSISALLSGLLVKVGILGFIAVNNVFTTIDSSAFFMTVGFSSAIVGGVFSISQKDIKRILAHSTISHIGIILIGLSIGATSGAISHIFNHMLFKSLLFLSVSLIINQYNTRHIYEIKGVFKTMPIVSIFIIIAILSITGAPFTNGSGSKYLISYGLKDSQLLIKLFYLINLLTIVSYIKLSIILFGKQPSTIKSNNKFYGSLFTLAALCLATGIYIQLWIIGLNSPSYYTSKVISYLFSLVIGFIIYKFIIKPDYFFIKKIRHFKPSFRMSNILFISFVTSLFGFLYISL